MHYMYNMHCREQRVCKSFRKQEEKKYKENLSKHLLRQTSHFACHLKSTYLQGPTKNSIALEALYMEDVSIAEGTGRVEEAEPKKAVIL
jgi:hypothetical protein